MKKVSKNKILAAVFVLSIITIPQPSFAQDSDWLSKQIEKYVRDEIEEALGIKQLRSIANSTNSYLGTFGNWLWENVVNSVAESNLEESAQKFAKYQPDDGPLKNLSVKYKDQKLWNNYSDIYTTQKSFSNDLIYSLHDVRLEKLAGGETKILHQKTIDSLNNQLASYDVVSPRLKEYIDSIQISSQDIIENLKASSTFAAVVNNHPETLDIYSNSLSVPSLKNNAIHLLYWGIKATSHVASLPPKTMLIKPTEIIFKNQNNYIQMMYDGKSIGSISYAQNRIYCDDIELLNLLPLPNFTYNINGIEYTTDRIGRVIRVKQSIQPSYKSKYTQKSKIKAKKAIQFLGDQNSQECYNLAFLNYQAPDCLINTVFYTNSTENKNAVKNIKKALKKQTKGGKYMFTLATEIKYNDTSRVPSIITVEVGDENFTIVNPSASRCSIFPVSHTKVDY